MHVTACVYPKLYREALKLTGRNGNLGFENLGFRDLTRVEAWLLRVCVLES